MTVDYSTRVLIVLEDNVFREQLRTILSNHGFASEVVQTLAEATSIAPEYALLITDSRLAQPEGARFVWFLRKSTSRELPIVMVTPGWLDDASLKWTREILKVSVVIQKSTVLSKYFLPTIESAMSDVNRVDTVCSASTVEQSAERSPSDKDVETQFSIEAAQARLREKVASEWQILSERIVQLEDSQIGCSDSEIRMQAHKLKGSGGSLGLTRLGKCAGTIEELLTMFFGRNDEFDRRLLFLELRALIELGFHSMGTIEYSSVEVHEPGDGQLTAVLVSDDWELCADFKKFFEDSGIFFISLEAPGYGLDDVLQDFSVRLLIIDTIVAGVSGYDLCCRIKQQHKIDQLAIVLLQDRSKTPLKSDNEEEFITLVKPVAESDLGELTASCQQLKLTMD